MRYDEFIASKAIVSIPTGIEPAEPPSLLFPFQRDIVRWALRRGRAAIFADCGLGKSAMQLSWADQIPGKVLILAPLAVARQTVREGKKFGIDLEYSRKPCDSRITITNYEMLDYFDPSEYSGIVLDECFAGDTSIDTPLGRKHIKDARIGDEILNASGVDIISDVHRREVPYAIKIKFSETNCISSPNHPFFTQRGWVGAQDLIPGDYVLRTESAVRMVWNRVYPKISGPIRAKILRDILLSEMADEPTRASSKGPYSRDRSKKRENEKQMAPFGRSKSQERNGKDQEFEPFVGPIGEGENIIPIESHRAQTFRAWGEWDRDDKTSIDASECSWRRMESGICFITGKTDSRISDLLQIRLRQSRAKNPHRGGWVLPCIQKRSGSQEGCQGDFIRLDGIEILESGNPELDKYRDEDGKLYFYDIGGTRHPSFSINGALVHNSSILKAYDGKFRNQIIESFRDTPFKLACTATPAPNDHMELGNHSEFLGVMSRTEMLSTFMVHDGGDTSQWRLKGHAQHDFWKWVCSWAVMIRNPSDLGYEDGDFNLPELRMHQRIVEAMSTPEGALFALEATTLQERQQARKMTTPERCAAVADIVYSKPDEPWLIWCDRNEESQTISKLIPDAVEITGSDSNESKEHNMLEFSSGGIRVIVTKPSIAGFGLNWQHCSNVVFLGLSDSYEQFYQAVRRCWRFGQKKPVNCYIVTSDIEGAVVANIQRKEADAARMASEMVAHMRVMNESDIRGTARTSDPYEPRIEMKIPNWLRSE